MNFADRLTSAVKRSGSVIAAGLDPRLEDLPLFVQEGLVAGTSLEDRLDSILSSFYLKALEKLSASVAAIKPNIAFFEQYGIGGLRAYEQVIAAARAMGLLVITDAKRGDIGSTAQAYSSAFLGKTSIAQESRSFFESDALTVNPYLGFDTLEVFINDCIKYKKGIFVLVKTSNPGSASIQDITDRKSGKSISALVADWLGENSGRLQGSSGYSGLGAVVGATYPAQAQELRALMPNNYFLIPGFGAQGGSAQDAAAGFVRGGSRPGGAIVNISRALFSASTPDVTESAYFSEFSRRLARFNHELNTALSHAP